MNYRHAYHAGNFADVVKHAILVLLLRALRRKDKPFFVLDTHAGTGRYDLAGIEARKTGEWRNGIARVIDRPDAPAEIADYLALAREDWPDAYPGSPLIARRMLRPGDRLAAAELHPGDAAGLKALFRGDAQVGVHAMDGYAAVKSLLPPPEKRGLVLIDPPFEQPDEFARMARALADGHRRFATGIFALWYPIKDKLPVRGFHDELVNSGIRKILDVQLSVRVTPDSNVLKGCGLTLINYPYYINQELQILLPWLMNALLENDGNWRLSELVGE